MAAEKSRFGWVKWLILLLVLLGAGAGGYAYWKNRDDAEIDFRTGEVTRGDITQAITATGQLNPVLNVQVGSQISGYIEKLFVDYNTRVTNGQIVAQIDPATYRANLLQAEGELANAKASLELAQVEGRRSEELLKNNLISKSEFDTRMAELHRAEAQVKIREGAVDRAKVDLQRTTIYAPIDGIVISRNVDVGQTVAANFSAPTLFVIANDLAKMQINAAVSEADIGTVESNQQVSFTVDAYPQRSFQGIVTQVRNAPITNQNVVTYDTIIEVNNDDLKLKPGMTANVSIIVAERQNVLRLPNSALRFRPPDTLMAKLNPKSTNTPAGAKNGTGAPGGGGGSEAGGGRDDFMRRFDKDGDGKLNEEERTAMRAEMAARSGGRGAGGGGGRRPRSENQPASRTIYLLATSQPEKVVQSKQVKTGISDGTYSEVIEGLTEGETVILGINTPQPAQSGQQPPPNPFGGGSRMRGMR